MEKLRILGDHPPVCAFHWLTQIPLTLICKEPSAHPTKHHCLIITLGRFPLSFLICGFLLALQLCPQKAFPSQQTLIYE